MPAFVKNLTFDCLDALRVARFWAAALGSDVDEDSTPEVARLRDLGATVVERFDDITVMHDPEGNEFCVEPAPEDPRTASGRL